MQFDNQKTRNVADAVAKILAGETVTEELKGNQHKIDKNKNSKIDSQDFEMLRKEKPMKQEASCDKMKKEDMDEGLLDKLANKITNHTMKKMAKNNPKAHAKFQKAQAAGVFNMKKEETDQIDEATPSRQQVKQAIGIARDKRYAGGNMTGAMKVMNKINKGLGQHPAVEKELKKQNEEAEQLDEYTPDKSGVTRIQGRAYGASKPEKHAVDTMSGPTRRELSAIEKEKKKPFKEMLELYAEKGLKALSEMTIKEEPDQEQFEKELAQAKKKATQKKTPEEEAGVAKAAVQSVKVEEVEQLDELSPKTLGSYVKKASNDLASSVHGERDAEQDDEHDAQEYHAKRAEKRMSGLERAGNKLSKEEVEQIDEKEMTSAEMKKREDIVMGMKKNLKGFKDRYGDRAKSVMYATATKQAMKDED